MMPMEFEKENEQELGETSPVAQDSQSTKHEVMTFDGVRSRKHADAQRSRYRKGWR